MTWNTSTTTWTVTWYGDRPQPPPDIAVPAYPKDPRPLLPPAMVPG